MKFCIILFHLLSSGATLFSQNWLPVINTLPSYSFSLPGNPTITDSLNIRLTYYMVDSMAVLNVLEINDTPFDSANTAFQDELQQNGGDTLRAITNSIGKSNNAIISNITEINSFPGYKGLEVKLKYNDLYKGKILIAFMRIFYNVHTLLSFTITGTQDNPHQLLNHKTLFFGSISL